MKKIVMVIVLLVVSVSVFAENEEKFSTKKDLIEVTEESVSSVKSFGLVVEEVREDIIVSKTGFMGYMVKGDRMFIFRIIEENGQFFLLPVGEGIVVFSGMRWTDLEYTVYEGQNIQEKDVVLSAEDLDFVTSK